MNNSINSLLSQRRSPYAFDPNKAVSESDINALFEAARWAMSSYNAQPWRYIVGVQGHSQQRWQAVFDCLLEGNQGWAKNAPVLALGLVKHNFEYNGKPNKAAVHDLGAASAMLTVEATSRNLVVHQMIGIDPDKARQTFSLEEDIEAFTGLAIGYQGLPEHVERTFAERDEKPRERKPLSDIITFGPQ